MKPDQVGGSGDLFGTHPYRVAAQETPACVMVDSGSSVFSSFFSLSLKSSKVAGGQLEKAHQRLTRTEST